MSRNGTSGLDALRERIRAAAARLGADDAKLPTYGASDHTGRPHVEVDDEGYHYVVCERGTEFERATSTDAEEIAFLACRDMAFEMACEQELASHVAGQDSRRRIFALELELLRALDPAWAERVRAENERILAEHPFVDGEPQD
jgi:immunity protein 63 of polymorphic toxin system